MRRAQKVVIGSKSTDIVEYAMSLLARVGTTPGRSSG